RMAFTIMSLVYIAFPMACTVVVYHLFGPQMTLFVFVLVWLNDTGAFLVGSAVGSHRLFARLSPKKSWEGFFGGVLVCIIAAWIVSGFSGVFAYVPGWMYMVLACGVSVLATWGDLFESMLKRNVGVKDSGNLIPGHGGILDRIDSLLFVMPGVLVLILFYLH
ncbi:MAG: phosphatidate cytidylyltransferase, partial [Paramuribaculum sp.]|nr:phosphatidate cytidylyltransferase [Paramuribaculum sp.]